MLAPHPLCGVIRHDFPVRGCPGVRFGLGDFFLRHNPFQEGIEKRIESVVYPPEQA